MCASNTERKEEAAGVLFARTKKIYTILHAQQTHTHTQTHTSVQFVWRRRKIRVFTYANERYRAIHVLTVEKEEEKKYQPCIVLVSTTSFLIFYLLTNNSIRHQEIIFFEFTCFCMFCFHTELSCANAFDLLFVRSKDGLFPFVGFLVLKLYKNRSAHSKYYLLISQCLFRDSVCRAFAKPIPRSFWVFHSTFLLDLAGKETMWICETKGKQTRRCVKIGKEFFILELCVCFFFNLLEVINCKCVIILTKSKCTKTDKFCVFFVYFFRHHFIDRNELRKKTQKFTAEKLVILGRVHEREREE